MKDLKVGLQLYTIRQAMTDDMDAALREVKAMGYDYVEMAGGRYDHTAEENLELIEKNGLKCISVHQSPSFYQADLVDAVSYVKGLCAPYAVIPMAAGRDEAFRLHWDETISLYTGIAEALQKEGVRLLYHNHDFEYGKLDGDDEYILHRLMSTIPASLLQPELDTCWISYGGVDPVKEIEAFSDRISVVHLKDYTCTALEPKPIWKLLEEGKLTEKPAKRSDVGFRYDPVGYGVQDWHAIMDAIYASAAEYVVVEQDSSKERDPLEAAAMSRRYLKDTFGI